MKINHRISIRSTPEIRRELAALRIFVGKGNPIASDVIGFDVDEDHALWPEIRSWIVTRKALDICRTTFSTEEVLAAKWLKVQPEWHYGYPQPKPDNFGYLQATYDLSAYCDECGIGKEQSAAFQIRGEPKWGRRGIFQLNWVFDEYFVKPDVWKQVFEPCGVGCRVVTNSRREELSTVLQLVSNDEIAIKVDGLTMERCNTCGRKKFNYPTRGAYPPLPAQPTQHLVKTSQWFGSGASANKCVIVSQSIARAVVSRNLRGISLTPIST